ncbi:MAG: hypothetical protein GEV10_22785 [Streptosporangiales bacterium]|nr:hypothetical protein [Streptosporangiales bacterium]
MTAEPTTDRRRTTSRVGALAGYLAATATAGLAVAHLTVYTAGFVASDSATWSEYLIGGPAVSLVAGALAFLGLTLARTQGDHRPRRLLASLAWLACALLTLQAVALALSGDLALFGPARPGTYSAVAGPAFGVLAWQRWRR